MADRIARSPDLDRGEMIFYLLREFFTHLSPAELLMIAIITKIPPDKTGKILNFI
jgi:hypothetical protein